MDINEILNDADALMGLGYADPSKQEGLLGRIMALPNGQRQQAISKLLSKRNITPGAGLTSRDKAEARIGFLPADIRKGLAAKNLQLVDSLYYIVKAANAVSTVKMLKGDDTLTVGQGNIANQKLEKDAWFLLTHVGLLSGNDVNPFLASFGVPVKQVLNGTMEFKTNGKYIFPKDTSLQIFDTTNRSNVDRGVVELDSPKWIEPQLAINLDLTFASATPANENIKLVMFGQTVMPY